MSARELLKKFQADLSPKHGLPQLELLKPVSVDIKYSTLPELIKLLGNSENKLKLVFHQNNSPDLTNCWSFNETPEFIITDGPILSYRADNGCGGCELLYNSLNYPTYVALVRKGKRGKLECHLETTLTTEELEEMFGEKD